MKPSTAYGALKALLLALPLLLVAPSSSLGGGLKSASARPQVARFSLEAKTAANIRHPAIVAVNDYSQTSRGVPFMVMELVEGDTLSEVIQRHGPARTDVARPLFAQVAGGLAAAHRSGVIHRDLKPENLLLTRDRSELKLVDFGLCIHWGAEERLTDHGELFGSIHYVAPERLSDAEPTAKSDVYSFGCVMFETFTGQPPFDAERQAAVARAHLEVEAPRTSVIAHQPIPDDLDDLISRCLEKDPEARPRMEEVEAVLCGRSLKRTVPFVRQEVSLVPPPPGPPGSLEVPRTPCDTDPVLVSHDALPVQRPARRRLLLLAAGGALLLVGSAAGAFVFLVSLPGS